MVIVDGSGSWFVFGKIKPWQSQADIQSIKKSTGW